MAVNVIRWRIMAQDDVVKLAILVGTFNVITLAPKLETVISQTVLIFQYVGLRDRILNLHRQKNVDLLKSSVTNLKFKLEQCMNLSTFTVSVNLYHRTY